MYKIIVKKGINMKFSDMKYERPDLDVIKASLADYTDKLRSAESASQAEELFRAFDKLKRHCSSLQTLAQVRHSIDTNDKFYDEEANFWSSAEPELQEYFHSWTEALLASPYRAEL